MAQRVTFRTRGAVHRGSRSTGDQVRVIGLRDDNRGYAAWIRAHPDAYVVNTQRSYNPNDSRLHRRTYVRDPKTILEGFVACHEDGTSVT